MVLTLYSRFLLNSTRDLSSRTVLGPDTHLVPPSTLGPLSMEEGREEGERLKTRDEGYQTSVDVSVFRSPGQLPRLENPVCLPTLSHLSPKPLVGLVVQLTKSLFSCLYYTRDRRPFITKDFVLKIFDFCLLF